ncbi:hypothetical protein J4Q44_G00149340 [Coregonus suidteri]|uniref:Uncharacterized protein n=1 Tax=Coregonus suidteri TaxID=861788 RepID=A0AAN8LND1_9TELE
MFRVLLTRGCLSHDTTSKCLCHHGCPTGGDAGETSAQCSREKQQRDRKEGVVTHQYSSLSCSTRTLSPNVAEGKTRINQPERTAGL